MLKSTENSSQFGTLDKTIDALELFLYMRTYELYRIIDRTTNRALFFQLIHAGNVDSYISLILCLPGELSNFQKSIIFSSVADTSLKLHSTKIL